MLEQNEVNLLFLKQIIINNDDQSLSYHIVLRQRLQMYFF
jgi:hypothetical protein